MILLCIYYDFIMIYCEFALFVFNFIFIGTHEGSRRFIVIFHKFSRCLVLKLVYAVIRWLHLFTPVILDFQIPLWCACVASVFFEFKLLSMVIQTGCACKNAGLFWLKKIGF